MDKEKLKSLALRLVVCVLAIGAVVGFVGKVKAVPPDFWENVAEKLASKLAEQVEELSGFLGASGSRFPNGLSADSTSPVAGEVRGTTMTFTGESQLSTVISGGSVLSTSTAGTTDVLTAAQICDNSVILYTPNGTGGLSLTLPTTSTLFADCLNTVGDSKSLVLQNTTSTAEADIVLTAGTGNVLVGSPTTTAATQDNAEEDSFVRMVFTRLGNDAGQLLVELLNFNDAD